ncbi:hypothetical protein M406DRAFT_357576 [Cryphonectria parasitica EP155]|uniref:Uncharacterized protein n=1 Tax=Cryphonectria parasitica (strain ATCC 38755 / EP155) TaxID=660469 RepID=A0A9P4XY91_CRYP1|nr:uncharacterized protein M406DRAFT_357576 [Cryphonectria parasitica EP155]KAF3762735.1 hypothetical protein M406DRAFT_357576 [Cryphonectria parasitica EP155]
MHSRLISLAVLYTVPRAPPESGFASNITSLSSVQYEAAELIFYPCINEYEVLVESGNPTTTVVSSSYEVADPSSDRYVNFSCYFTEQNSGICDMDTYSSVPWDVTVPAPMMYLKDPASPNSNTTTFGMTYGTLAATAVDLFNALSGFATYTADGLAYVGMGEVPTIWYNLFGNSTEDATQRAIIMDALMQNVATSMTNVIRMFPSSGDGMNSFTVNGTATSPETFVEIHWGWLAFLASELVLSIIFVIGTIIHTARLAGRVLNSSSLAALAALDESSRSALGGIDDPQAMKRKAAGIRVQLLGSELVMV